MVDIGWASRAADTLFGPIDGRDRAEELAGLLRIVVLALAAVVATFTLHFGSSALALAALVAVLGGLLWWRRSVFAALALLVLFLAASALVLRSVVHNDGTVAAWALVVTLAGVWAGGRAVACAIALRRLPPTEGKESQPRG